MSAPPKSRGTPITNKRQLIDYLESGNKPKSEWRIGTEHEKFAFRRSDLRSLPFDGPDGIESLLKGLTEFGWEPISENDRVIALTKGAANITLEPGGQVELSGAPVINIHDTCDEVHDHLAQVKSVGDRLGIGMLGMGFQPKWSRDETPWMPKGRYRIMRDQMMRRGKLGLDMMLRTCTVQVNLDFSDEADMVKKLRVSMALQPIATALFANSPFTEGKPNGFLSYRSHIWTDTDPDRCGTLPFVFEPGMGFERYVDYMLDVPMYFVYRDGQYIDAAGQSFRDFLLGKLPSLPGEIPTTGDWADHLTTAFPEVRLKKFLEMRGADGGPWQSLCALPALWVGLLYDQDSLDAAWDLVKNWTKEDHAHLRAMVPQQALKTPFHNGTVQDIARQVVDVAEQGLRVRARTQADETAFLLPLRRIVETGTTPAEEKLAAYRDRWQEKVDPLFLEAAY